jgi:tellurite resistance protein
VLAVPQIKKNVIEACMYVVDSDGLIQEREAALLHAIADTLDCPIPPFVEITESEKHDTRPPL